MMSTAFILSFMYLVEQVVCSFSILKKKKKDTSIHLNGCVFVIPAASLGQIFLFHISQYTQHTGF